MKKSLMFILSIVCLSTSCSIQAEQTIENTAVTESETVIESSVAGVNIMAAPQM